jgi:hypothetical protein
VGFGGICNGEPMRATQLATNSNTLNFPRNVLPAPMLALIGVFASARQFTLSVSVLRKPNSKWLKPS